MFKVLNITAVFSQNTIILIATDLVTILPMRVIIPATTLLVLLGMYYKDDSTGYIIKARECNG